MKQERVTFFRHPLQWLHVQVGRAQLRLNKNMLRCDRELFFERTVHDALMKGRSYALAHQIAEADCWAIGKDFGFPIFVPAPGQGFNLWKSLRQRLWKLLACYWTLDHAAGGPLSKTTPSALEGARQLWRAIWK